MRRRNAYGQEVDEDPFLSQVDYDSLLRPGATPLAKTTPTLQASPMTATPAPVAAARTAAMPAATAAPQTRGPVAGSRFVDYGRLFAANAGKAQQGAARASARAEAAAAEAAARLQSAQTASPRR